MSIEFKATALRHFTQTAKILKRIKCEVHHIMMY